MLDGLEHAAGFVRRQIARNLELRFAPEVRFFLDTSIEKGERFLKTLEELHAEEQAKTSTKGRPTTDDR
jgi:ribosome-binding factor A